MSVYLVIDLGTTGCRSILFDQELRQLADCYREYGLMAPREKWAEQDAVLWWSLSLETAKGAIAASGISPREIDGISVSSQGITIVPVDREWNPLCNAISWLDVRAERQTQELEQMFGMRQMFTLTGKQINPAYSLPKILWLKEEASEIYRKAWKILMPMDYLIGKLTGNCVTDHSMASGTLLYDIRGKVWSREVLHKCGISEELLPELKWSGEPAGTVLPEVARELGLREDCVVAVGAQDQRCAALGAGLEEGVMTVSLGTAGAICKYWSEAKTAGSMRIGWSAYVHENSWVTEGVVNTAAVCLRWLRDTMFPGKNYDDINVEAAAALERGSSLLFYPYLNGPSCPDNYPGAEGCFYGANLATQRGDFALAVMEGVAFQIRIILEAMEAYGNEHTLVLFGGGARSPLWCQLIADITGMRITVPETAEAAGAGAAVLAGLGAGQFSRAQLPKVRSRMVYEPGNGPLYAEKYEKYRAIERKLWQAEKG